MGRPRAAEAMVALIVFCFFLPGHERPPAGSVRLGAADLNLGAVQAHHEAFSGGVGQHVGQGVQADAGGGGEAPVGQQRRDLMYRGGDGGAVHAVPQRQSLVWQSQTQPRQGDQHPVAQAQRYRMPSTRVAASFSSAPASVQPPFPGCVKRFGQFGDQPVEVVARDAGEDRMGQGRTGLLDRHKSTDRAALYGARTVALSVSCGFAAGTQDRLHARSAVVPERGSDVRLVAADNAG